MDGGVSYRCHLTEESSRVEVCPESRLSLSFSQRQVKTISEGINETRWLIYAPEAASATCPSWPSHSTVSCFAREELNIWMSSSRKDVKREQ